MLTSQAPVPSWHERFKDPTLADAILDRLVHDAHRLELKGDSMRKNTSPLTENGHLTERSDAGFGTLWELVSWGQ